jgi:hypothetical protein
MTSDNSLLERLKSLLAHEAQGVTAAEAGALTTRQRS